MKTTGSVRFELKSGRFEGRACVTNASASYGKAFALNAALNVASVTDGDGKPVEFDGWFNPGVDGEARVYTLNRTPPVLCVAYVGALPVYPAHDAQEDFKGLIAFNGDSLRATEQSAWLPIPYDTATHSRTGNTAYDLQVTCDGCRFLYMNGGAPVEQTEGRFISAIPRAPLVFGGTGPITRTPSMIVLNEAVPEAQATALSGLFGNIETFYARYMGQPIADKPTLLRMVILNQVERDRHGSSWGFASWPTIALSGSVGRIGDLLIAGGEKADSETAYLAHEAGHYYFGTLSYPSGVYYWFLLESAAEFLSLEAERAIRGPAAADLRVRHLIASVEKGTKPLVALDRVHNQDEIHETYRYSYGPLLLLSLERTVGEAKMRAFMRALMHARVERWEDLQHVALQAGIDKGAWESWRAQCVANGTQTCVTAEALAVTKP
jgi:hypothetical protein